MHVGPAPTRPMVPSQAPGTAVVRETREDQRGASQGTPLFSFGVATEELNRHWYGPGTGQVRPDLQRHVKRTASKRMAATHLRLV